MRLAEMLRATMETERPNILPEAAIARLAEHATRYAEQISRSRFAIGDLVTPVSDCDLKGAGDPHLVIDTRSGAAPEFGTASHIYRDGARLDMRVLFIHRDSIVALWTESFKFKRWAAKPLETADVSAAD